MMSSSLYFSGWVREVIYDRDDSGKFCDKPKEILYHAPKHPGTKSRQFKSLAELGSFCKSQFCSSGTTSVCKFEPS